MFKYRVLTFTIILSMLLFYVTPIGCIYVKAGEVEYSQQQLQDVGAWFIGERLLEGAIENFDFSNLPTGVTAENFLADLGSIIVEGNPDPLIDDLGQAADDIWNSIEQELNSWSAEDGWNFVKNFFYTLWYDVPSSPSLPPLANVFGIAGNVLEASGIDKYLQFVNTDIPDTNPDPNYANLINSINGTEPWQFFWKDYNTFFDGYVNNASNPYFILPLPSISYIATSYYSTPIVPSNYKTKTIATCDLTSIYINGSNDSYSFSTNFISRPFISIDSTKYGNGYCNQFKLDSFYLYIEQSQEDINFTYTYNIFKNNETLQSCLEYIYQYCRNVNIYVNGDPWSIVYVEPQNPIASSDLTYPNYEPAKYIYPEGTSVDWNRLYTIIYNAVHDGIVIDFGDLEDCFVDVNGQTAIATLGLVRNDYDKLVDEQFNMVPYPRFNNNLWLSNLAAEMTEPAQNGVSIIENTYNIFPLPLQKALLFAGALLLFGLLIRRFLE